MEDLILFLEKKIKIENIKNNPRKEVIDFIQGIDSLDKNEIDILDYYLLENKNPDIFFVEKILKTNKVSYFSLLISLVLGFDEIFIEIFKKSTKKNKEKSFTLVSSINNKKLFKDLIAIDSTGNNVPVFNKFINTSYSLLKNFKYDKQTIFDTTNFLENSKYDFLNLKNVNTCIKEIYPESGKKTF